MGEPNSQSESTETQKYFRFVSNGGGYGCQIPVNANHAVIQHKALNECAICYNESDDVSDLKDHRSPENQFGEQYSQYDWYCWVDDYELLEEELSTEPDDETPVVFASSGGFHLVVERDKDVFEIEGDTLYADEDAVMYDGSSWPADRVDEPLDVGIFFNELHFTRYGDAMERIEELKTNR